MKAHARQVTRRRGQRTCLFSGHSERLVHARVVAVFHRIVACGVVVGRAGRQGRRADGLLDDWLLLERVERRRVWQDPLERAPCVAPGPARKIRSPEPPRRRRPAALQSGGAGGAGGAGRRVSGLLPADSLIRVFLVQVCDEVVLVHCSQGRGLARAKSVWRWPRPRHGHDPDKRAPPHHPAARITQPTPRMRFLHRGGEW